MSKSKKQGRNTFEKWFWRLVFMIAVVLFVGSGLYVYQYFRDTQNTKNISGDLSDMMEQDDVDEIESEYGIKIPDGFSVNFARLYAENNEVFGWIRIPELGINNVVVKADDNDKYLYTDFYGKSSRHGTVFADCGNTYDSDNIVLYGHHMRDGTMFAPLTKYKTLEGYQSAPTIEFSTVRSEGTYKIFAVMLTNAVAEDDNGYVFDYMISDFGDDGTFGEFIEQVRMRSLYNIDVDVKPGDRLLTLSTCDYDFREERLVVVARLVRDGESTDVSTDNASWRNGIRFPQVWYDKRGRENPFANYEQWTP